MNFRNLFLSIFLVIAVGIALVQAEEAKPRGPKITSKVIHMIMGSLQS
jgi:peptidyl-prolyl cis-trans isomerase B (cyclophilin B)